MVPRLSVQARALLRHQRHVIATWQGPTVDLLPRSMSRAVDAKDWRAITERTFLAVDSEPDAAQRRIAAVLEYGPFALMAGTSALVEAGWAGKPGPRVDVIVPRGSGATRRTSPRWLQLRTGFRFDTALGVVPMVGTAESLIDAAAWARSDREAMFVAVSALQARVVTPAGLRRALDRRQRQVRRRLIRDVVDGFIAGSTSVGELDLVAGCRTRNIPLPVRQRRRKEPGGRVRYLDAEFVAADGVLVLVSRSSMDWPAPICPTIIPTVTRNPRTQARPPITAGCWMIRSNSPIAVTPYRNPSTAS